MQRKAREGKALPAAIVQRWSEGRSVYNLEEEKPEYEERAVLAIEKAELEWQSNDAKRQ